MCWNEQTQCPSRAFRRLERASRAQSLAHSIPLPHIPGLLCPQHLQAASSFWHLQASSSFWRVRPALHQAAEGPSSQPHSSLGHEAVNHILTQSTLARAIWWPRATALPLTVTLVPRSKDHLLIVVVASRWQRRVFPVGKRYLKLQLLFWFHDNFFLFWGTLLTVLLKISYLWAQKPAKTKTVSQKLSKGHGAFSPILLKTGRIKYHFPLFLPSPSLSVASYLASFHKGGKSSCRKLMSQVFREG